MSGGALEGVWETDTLRVAASRQKVRRCSLQEVGRHNRTCSAVLLGGAEHSKQHGQTSLTLAPSVEPICLQNPRNTLLPLRYCDDNRFEDLLDRPPLLRLHFHGSLKGLAAGMSQMKRVCPRLAAEGPGDIGIETRFCNVPGPCGSTDEFCTGGPHSTRIDWMHGGFCG